MNRAKLEKDIEEQKKIEENELLREDFINCKYHIYENNRFELNKGDVQLW